MATIKYYLDPEQPPEIEEAVSVAASLLKRWPGGHGAPAGLRIYRDTVSSATDITDEALRNPRLLTDPSDDVYHCVVTAGDLIAILTIVAVVIAVATVLLLPSIPGALPNANRTQQSPNNSLGARSNQARPGQRSADIRGKQRNAYPDLLQVPYRRFRSGIEYEYLYAEISEGFVALNDIKDGDTEFARLGGRLAVYGPDTSPLSGTPELIIGGAAPDEMLYEVRESNEIDGVTLVAPNASEFAEVNITITSAGVLSVPSGIDFTEFLEVGEFVTLTDFYFFDSFDPETGYSRDNLGGTFEVTAVSALSITLDVGTEWSSVGASYVVPRFAWTNNNRDWWLEDTPGTARVDFFPAISGVGSAGPIGPIDASDCDRIWINVVAQNGLYKDNGQNLISTVVNYTLKIYELDINGDLTGNITQHDSFVAPLQNNLQQFTGNTLDVVNPYSRAEITLERISPTDKGFNGTVVDEIKWRNLYLVKNVSSVDSSYATTVHAEIRATPLALRVKERKLNMTVTRKVANYLGDGLFSPTETTITDLFAPVVASIWRDPLFGRGEDDEVNWENLFAVQAEMIEYYSDSDPCRVGYTFDSDKITAEDAIKLICDAVNVIPYRIGSVLNFWFERPQSQSALFFGHRFKHPGTDSRSRRFAPENNKTGVELTYFSEITGSFETVTRGDQIDPLRIELPACITARGAQIRVDREWNKLRYSRVQQTFDATAIGRMTVPGMRVDVVDNTRRAPFDGEIRAVNGLTVTISQPIELPVPTDYSIVLTRADGSLESISVAAQPASDKITLATASAEPVRVSRLADRTVYSIGTDDMRSKLAMLVREITPKDYNRVTIGAINYDDRYYSEDLTG